METPSSKDFAYAMTLLKYISWPMGTWPLQEYNAAAALRFFIAFLLLMLTMVVLHIEIYLNHSNVEKNMDVILLLMSSLLAIAKILAYRVHSDDLVSNFVSAVNDYNELNNEKNRKIMRHHAYMSRMAFASVVVLSYSGSMVITISKLLLGKEVVIANDNASTEAQFSYPMPSEYVLELMNIPQNLYPLIFFMEYFLMIVISTGNLGSDSLFFGITFHLCGQAELLKEEFIKPVNDKEDMARHFDALTKRHCHLLNLVAKLNSTVSFVLAIQLFTSCVLICTSGFQFLVSLVDSNLVMIVKTLIIAIVLGVQLFVYNYVSDYLMNQMEGIGYSAYCCNWYVLPKYLSRDIIFILMRSQRPINLKAAGFFILNLESYMSIVKTSMSYLSVLRMMI